MAFRRGDRSGKERLADALAEGLHLTRGADLPESAVAKMRNKAFAAPCTVVLIASPHPESNVPVWEQVASASCTGYAVVLAAVALGFGAVWKSAAVLDTQPVRSLFGLSEDGATTRMGQHRYADGPPQATGCASGPQRVGDGDRRRRTSFRYVSPVLSGRGGASPPRWSAPAGQGRTETRLVGAGATEIQPASTGAIGSCHPSPPVASCLLEAGGLRPPGRGPGAASAAGAEEDFLFVGFGIVQVEFHSLLLSETLLPDRPSVLPPGSDRRSVGGRADLFQRMRLGPAFLQWAWPVRVCLTGRGSGS